MVGGGIFQLYYFLCRNEDSTKSGSQNRFRWPLWKRYCTYQYFRVISSTAINQYIRTETKSPAIAGLWDDRDNLRFEDGARGRTKIPNKINTLKTKNVKKVSGLRVLHIKQATKQPFLRFFESPISYTKLCLAINDFRPTKSKSSTWTQNHLSNP